MKKKVLLFTVFVIILLMMSPFVSAFNIIPDKKITLNNDNGKEKSSEGKPLCFQKAVIHVSVLYYSNFTKCPGATVVLNYWVGILILPVFFLLLQLPFAQATKKITDENGECTFFRLIPNRGSIFPVVATASKGGLSGWTSTLVGLKPGDNYVQVLLMDNE